MDCLVDCEISLKDLVVEGRCEDRAFVLPKRTSTREEAFAEPVVEQRVDVA